MNKNRFFAVVDYKNYIHHSAKTRKEAMQMKERGMKVVHVDNPLPAENIIRKTVEIGKLLPVSDFIN